MPMTEASLELREKGERVGQIGGITGRFMKKMDVSVLGGISGIRIHSIRTGIKAKAPYIPQPIIRSPQHYVRHRKRINLCVNK